MIDNFLSDEIAKKLSKSFPADELFNHPKKDLHENKLEGDRFDLYPDIFSVLKAEIEKPEFSKFIEGITGIKGAFVTDDSYGVGIQKGKKGSFEDVHIDFNIHPEKDVQHRLNFQLFLSPTWKAEWNGALEMWNDCVSKCKKAVSCRFNRAIIFEVKDTAYYGYTKPLECPDNADRKVFSANFYTVKEEQNIAYHDTIFPISKDTHSKSSIFSTIKKALKVS
jgi:Rps23 Pro-64 3,4-dihydroxylase Tpa1-like proline 4-hydroxylase